MDLINLNSLYTMYTLYTMNDNNKYPVVIHSRIDHKTMDRLNKVCNIKKWTVSTLIREILEDYLK